jgi:hypothetical protein
MKFELTPEQNARVTKWLKETVYPAVIEKQRATIKIPHSFAQECWDAGYPWEGASGGGLTYNFTPTSIATIETVQYGEFKLDVTAYEDW